MSTETFQFPKSVRGGSDARLLSIALDEDFRYLQLWLNKFIVTGAGIEHGGLIGLADDDHTQYHIDSRALTWLGTRSTTDLPEGSNLYYTDGRADARIALADLADLATQPHTALTGVTADQHHAQAHTVASHSDTTGTGAELETLTDGSDASGLHTHAAVTGTHDLEDHADVTLTLIGVGEVLTWDGVKWINETLAEAGISAVGHTHTEANITDLTHVTTIVSLDTLATGAELTTLTDGSDADALHVHSLALSTASDVTITGILSGEILKWNGSAWINNTLAEAGISGTAHTHTHAATTGKTANDHHNEAHTVASHSDTTATGAELNTLTDGSDGDALHGHTEALSTASDVTITAIADNELLRWNGTIWINNTLAEAGIAAVGAAPTAHTIASHSDTTGTGAELNTLTGGGDADALHGHTEALSTASDVTITGVVSGELLKWSGTAWINQTLAEAGIAAAGVPIAGADHGGLVGNADDDHTQYLLADGTRAMTGQLDVDGNGIIFRRGAGDIEFVTTGNGIQLQLDGGATPAMDWDFTNASFTWRDPGTTNVRLQSIGSGVDIGDFLFGDDTGAVILGYDKSSTHWEFKQGIDMENNDIGDMGGIEFLNSFGDVGGRIFAFDTTTRDILIMHAGTSETLNAVRFQVYGPGDAIAPNDAALVAFSTENIWYWDDSADTLQINKKLTGDANGPDDRRIDGNSGAEMYWASGTGQAVLHNTTTTVTFDTTVQDDDSFVDLVNNRFTAGVDGWYMLSMGVRWPANTTGVRRLVISASGGTQKLTQLTAAPTSSHWHSFSVPMYLTAAETVVAQVLQTSTVTLTLNGGLSHEQWFSIVRMF